MLHHDYSELYGEMSARNGNVGRPFDDDLSHEVYDDDYPTVEDQAIATSNTTIDSAPYLFIATLVLCLVLNMLLCCMVTWTRRRTRRLHEKRQAHLKSIEATLTPNSNHLRSYALPTTKDIDADEVLVSLDVADDFSESQEDESDNDTEETHDDEEDDEIMPSFEVVLKKRRFRRRKQGRSKQVMERLEIIYQTGNEDIDDAKNASHSRTHTPWATLEEIAQWDLEMKRLVKLALPFVAHAAIQGGFDTMTLAVIGKLVGTRELSAYVVVTLLLKITGRIVAGIPGSLATLCTRGEASNNNTLVGQYTQLSIIFYTLLSLPICLFWYFCMGGVLAWFGFDEETVAIGNDYVMVVLLDFAFLGINESLHTLLNIIHMQTYSTMLVAMEEACSFLAVLLVSLLATPSLQAIGMIHFLTRIAFLIINILILCWKGWLGSYLYGLMGTFALRDKKLVKRLLRTGLTLSFGYIVAEGEWEILTLFARFLGPTAVVAWGILATLWDTFEMITEAIGDAAEVRCAYFLGVNEPERAKLTAYKALFVGSLLAGLVSSLIFLAGNQIPHWLTNEPTLQDTLKGLMPFFALGNIVLTMGQLCWAILGSQGRYRVATATSFFGTCFICIPLAAAFTLILDFDLSGQTAALVIANLASGTCNAYIMFTSDWNMLAADMVARKQIHQIYN